MAAWRSRWTRNGSAICCAAHSLPKGAVAVIYDRNGAILATNDSERGARTSRLRRMKAGFPDGASLDAYQAGRAWRFGNVALLGNTMFVAFAEQEQRLFGQTYVHVGIDFLLPIAMILFAWIAIWFATDRQVTQWIAYLRRIAIAYRSGHYTIRPDLADAPTEFKQLGEAMSEMAGGIQDRDRRLRESVKLKTTLIREIHHRVKNNLQIVMSLLSIQANQVKDVHAREALMQAQTRINALALVHRILNELEDQSTLDLKQLARRDFAPDRRRHGRHRACARRGGRAAHGGVKRHGGGGGAVHRRGADQYLQACLSRARRKA